MYLCSIFFFETASHEAQAGLELTIVAEDNLELPIFLPLPPKCALLCLAPSIFKYMGFLLPEI